MNDICSVMDPECCNSFQIWLGTFRVSDPSYVIEVIFGIFFFKTPYNQSTRRIYHRLQFYRLKIINIILI